MRKKNRELKLKKSTIRATQADDLPFLIDVVNTSGLFAGDMLPGMIEGYLKEGSSQEHWLTYETDKPIALAYFAPEPMTLGTWNLYLIAVHEDFQGEGIGTQLMSYVEQLLTSKGERILIVETSDLEAFSLTREFYLGLNYVKEAHIREFYDEGEGKIVFWKRLS